jgi:hypothetical protein
VRRQGLVLGGAAVALCAWCGWVSSFHRSTRTAETAWVFSLAAVSGVDIALWRGRRRLRFGWRLQPVVDPWPRPGRGGGRLALRGLAPWIVLFAVALTWDVLGLDTGPHAYHLTISALAQAYRPLNAALLLVWMLVGIGYSAARARSPLRREGSPDPPVNVGPETPEPGAALGAGIVTAGGHPVLPALLLPSSPAAGVAFWIAIPIAALLVDRSARRSQGRVANAEELARFISTPMVANVALIAAWAFAGYHLFAR